MDLGVFPVCVVVVVFVTFVVILVGEICIVLVFFVFTVQLLRHAQCEFDLGAAAALVQRFELEVHADHRRVPWIVHIEWVDR